MRSSWRIAASHGGLQAETASMNGETPPSQSLAGCLGKAEDRGKLTGDCPWCAVKGQTSVLRSYAINFKESITLCSSPLCLFPLVSRPLEDIRASLFSPKDTTACKRKSNLSQFEDLNPSPKRQKKDEFQTVAEASDCRVSTESFEEELFTDALEEQKVVGNYVKERCIGAPSVSNERLLSEKVQTEDYVSSTQNEAEEALLKDIATPDLLEMVPTQKHLFWRNKDNLCWLDSLLVALVHFRMFSEAVCNNISLTDSKNCAVKNLIARYKKTCAYLKTKEQKCDGNVVRVPLDVLQKAEQKLEAIQLSVFQLLQPRLQCELGQKETPVFALPLLLRADEWAQNLFQHVGQWEFKCTFCGYALSTSVEKTVTTFTQLMVDWHPLRAVHKAQCSNCHRKNQRRKLVFQRLSTVLALHFVEGLPRKDVSRYSFDFEGTRYDIRTIIQYNEQLEHFVTWIHQPDGLWLEFDDLKYPHCIDHKRCTLRASQFHLVFWEAESFKDFQHVRAVSEEDIPIVENGNESVTNDTCIVEALTVNEDINEPVNSLDSSIGSTTLLDTFEGLSHSDIVTLTLVEVKVDAEGKPLQNSQETVVQTAKSIESSAPQSKTSVFQTPTLPKHKTSVAKAVSLTPVSPEITSPSEKPPPVSKHLPPPSKPNVSNLSFLLHQYQSTPLRVPLPTSQPKPDLRHDGNEALPAKPADLFGGFRAKTSPNAIDEKNLRHSFANLPGSQPTVPLPQKPFSNSEGTAASIQAVGILKSVCKRSEDTSAAKLSTTDIFRLKLMKKLKAKKKKLAKLNQLLGKCEGKPTPRPDSTDLTSPYSVTSTSTSVYDSPEYDNFFAELLSPATTNSNLSPDSTGLMEMLNKSQGGETSDNSPQENPAQEKTHISTCVVSALPVNDPSSTNDNFLDELISEPRVQQSAMENADFNALDMFF